jgi:hypothetical protein
MALLCLLMLRGPQTSGELNGRSDRLHHFEGPAEVEGTLDALIDRELVARLPRRPGERGQRYVQLLGGEEGDEAPPSAPPAAAAPAAPAAAATPSPPPEDPPASAPAPPAPAADGALEERVARLERELGALRDDVRSLREQLGG